MSATKEGAALFEAVDCRLRCRLRHIRQTPAPSSAFGEDAANRSRIRDRQADLEGGSGCEAGSRHITGSRDEDTANLEFELKRGEGQAEQTLATPALTVGEAKKASVKITEIQHYESLEIAATPFWKTGAD